ncbi:Dihydropteroate synthase-like protein [Crucibulum laeve]|uniref:Dihydropteroate synthase-like protein n=1 Tax=Crucibulum laeve TaxID=68775 RepID=A0A5C3M613_9AGAR|nr:Dihydropteroate synthase-like protein [Crucibulum laeve]
MNSTDPPSKNIMAIMHAHSRNGDLIRINDLLLTVSLCTGAHWPQTTIQATPQPVLISVSIPYDIRHTASTDDLSHSINYATLSNEIRDLVSSGSFKSLDDLSSRIYSALSASSLKAHPGIHQLHLKVIQTKAPLHCREVGLESIANILPAGQWEVVNVKHFLDDLTCPTIIGINPAERLEKQVVKIRITISSEKPELVAGQWLDFRALIRHLYEEVYKSHFLTLEALTSFVAHQTLLTLWNSASQSNKNELTVNVAVAKPSALVFASSSEVEVTRSFRDYPGQFDQHTQGVMDDASSSVESSISSSSLTKVALALGSNLGDRFHNIELALRLLEAPENLITRSKFEPGEGALTASIVDTSFLYETAPMYVTDQPSFVNCACIIETNIPPVTLLNFMKKIESTVGRVPSIRNGPRAVDLDILFYGTSRIDTRLLGERDNLDNLTGQLVVPHPRLGEREFVLRPLHDMIPDFVHPVYKQTIGTLLNELTIPTDEPPMQKVIPFPRYPLSPGSKSDFSITSVPSTHLHWTIPPDASMKFRTKAKPKTHIMATLNATPDSFSDGSKHNTLTAALSYAQESVASGSTIIDVGGYSTRPGAAFVSVEDEINRVVPVVKAIRQAGPTDDASSLNSQINERVRDTPISVDTFRWEVAEASIKAGANCINDVYAFTGPSYLPSTDAEVTEADVYMAGMKRVARDLAVPVILMHSRGDAGQNKDYRMYDYAGRDATVVEGVRIELGEKVDRIVKGKGGIRRWFVIADPGLGFSKTLEGNLEVLRNAEAIVDDVVVGQGHSRKRNPLSGYPTLIGPSRKFFLGVILAQGEHGRETIPKDRSWATATAVVCAVQQGATVVRVHDTKEMADVVRVADALWR